MPWACLHVFYIKLSFVTKLACCERKWLDLVELMSLVESWKLKVESCFKDFCKKYAPNFIFGQKIKVNRKAGFFTLIALRMTWHESTDMTSFWGSIRTSESSLLLTIFSFFIIEKDIIFTFPKSSLKIYSRPIFLTHERKIIKLWKNYLVYF